MERGQIEAEFIGLLVAIIVTFALLYIGVGILEAGSDNPEGYQVNDRLVRLGATGDFVDVKETKYGDNETVVNSLGNAVRLTGADDSYVQSDRAVQFATDSNWTVSTWARVNESAASENMTAISLNGRVIIQYNGTEGNWSVWYYDDGSANSYRANVAAPNQPGNFSLIVAQHNGTHLTVYRNQTKGDVVNTTPSSIEPVRVNTTNWHGSLEETRTFDANITDSQRDTLFTDPIDAVPNSPTARLYYDAGSGTTVSLFHAGGDATLSNGTWVSGFEGETMDVRSSILDLTGGNDYEWDNEGPQIRPLAGGRLADQPAAWVTYTEYGEPERFAFTVLDTFDTAAAVPALLIAIFAAGLLIQFRRR